LVCRCAHFAIYDGHGGRLAAEFAKKHLHLNVLSAGLPRELVCLTWFILIMSLQLFSCHSLGLTSPSSLSNCCFSWMSKLLKRPFLKVSGKLMSCSCKKVFQVVCVCVCLSWLYSASMFRMSELLSRLLIAFLYLLHRIS
jgi:hypothetical protein